MPRSSDEIEDSSDRSSRRRAVASRVAARRSGGRAASERSSIRKKTETSSKDRVDTPTPRVEKVVPEPSAAGARKAPTNLADEKFQQRRKQQRLIVVGVVLLIGIGASAAVGFTDKGEIDVLQTIEARNERIRTNQATEQDTLISTIEVPVQNTNARKADGGLKGRGTGGASKPIVTDEVATSTASSTDVTASSTEAIATSTESSVTDDTGEEVMETEEAVQPEAVPLEDSAATEPTS